MICQCGVESCGCSPRCPDYYEMGRREVIGPLTARRVEKLLAANEDVRTALRWWPVNAALHDACAYCDLPFRSMRAHSATCSTACRVALSVAQRMQQHEVPHALSDSRRTSYSAERERATGRGFMSRQEAYEADMRCARPDED